MWKHLNGPYHSLVTALLSLPNGDMLAGTMQDLVVSRDGGKSWLKSYPSTITDMKLLRGGDVVAKEGYARCHAIISTDAGGTWETVVVHADSEWDNVFLTESGGLILQEHGGQLIHTSDRGKTWSVVKLPEGTGRVVTMGFGYDGQGITVSERHKIICSKDGGRSWGVTGNEYPYGFSSMRILDNGDVFLLKGEGLVYRSTNRGKSWTELKVEPLRHLFLSLPGGRLIGESTTNGLVESSDYGSSWSAIGMPRAYIEAVTFDKDSNLVVASDRGILRIDRKNKQRWTLISSGWMPAQVQCMAFGPMGTIYAGTHSGLYRSDDDGSTWENISTSFVDLDILSVLAVSDDRVYTTSWTGLLMSSSDRGESWICLNSGTGPLVNAKSLCSDSSGNVYVGCGRGVARLSVDDGKLHPTVNDYNRVERLHFSATDESFYAVFVTLWADDEGPPPAIREHMSLHRSDNGCRTWKELIPEKMEMKCVAIDPKGSIVIGTDTSGVQSSTDHGENWRRMRLNNLHISSVVALDSAHVIAAADSGVYVTADAGENWKRIYSPAKSQLPIRFIFRGPHSRLYLGLGEGGLRESVQQLP